MTDEINTENFTREEMLQYARMPETGDYAIDCKTGRDSADALIVRMAESGYTPALQYIVRNMVQIGRWEAVHVGFFQRLADRSLPIPA